MSEHDEFLGRVVQTLREPVRIDPALDRRVMAEIEALPHAGPAVAPKRSVFKWLTEGRTISISPLGAMAMAAGMAVLVVVGARFTGGGDADPLGRPTALQSTGFNQVQFVLVAPEAGAVSLVGDFNDWDIGATPLVREEGDGVWAVTIPLPPGRYRYSYLVDGTTWRRDPLAARTIEDEFGRPNSVLTIGGA